MHLLAFQVGKQTNCLDDFSKANPHLVVRATNERFISMFKIEVFNALQTQFGLSKCYPELKMRTSLEVLHRICMPQEPTSAWYCHYKKWS
jgi:hypothetical protein